MANSQVKGSGCGTREWREDFKLEDKDGNSICKIPYIPAGDATVFNDGSVDVDFRVESNGNANAIFVDAGNDRVGIFTASPTVPLEVTGNTKVTGTFEATGAVTLGSTVARTGQKYIYNALTGKVGATSGWVITGGTNIGSATLPASQSGSTLVIPISGAKVGWTVTSFHLLGQIESAGGTVTVDADLRKTTTAAADLTDASIGAMSQLSVTADTAMSVSNTNKASLSDTIGADEMLYVLITATTAGSTDIDLQGVAVTFTEA